MQDRPVPKTSSDAYRMIHEYAGNAIWGGIDGGMAFEDFFQPEMRLAALMREIEEHTDINPQPPQGNE